MKKILLYFTLFLLVVLLFTPPLLRMLVSDKKEAPEKPKDIYDVIDCRNNRNELINETFLNSKAYSLLYVVPIDVETDLDNSLDEEWELLPLRSYASLTENEEEKTHSYRIEFGNLEDAGILNNYSKEIDSQVAYYQSLGFTCTKTSF